MEDIDFIILGQLGQLGQHKKGYICEKKKGERRTYREKR
jgi:hypothetical protein